MPVFLKGGLDNLQRRKVGKQKEMLQSLRSSRVVPSHSMPLGVVVPCLRVSVGVEDDANAV